MRILITGGAGFIGSHLAERLLGQGHEVHVADRKPLADWPESIIKECKIARCDVSDPDIRDNRHADWFFRSCDFIYHLASTVGVRRVLEDPSECISNNIDSLRAVLALGIPGLFTSTSEVYGKTSGPLAESSPIEFSAKSRWSYAASKLIGEWMALQAGWKVVRLFNVVGPKQSSEYGAVLPNFVEQALAGEPLTVYGSGDQVRTFIDVRDCVEILDRLREKTFDVVNVGGTHVANIKELAKLVALELAPSNLNYMPRVEHLPYSTAYPSGFEECPERVPDLTKLDSLLPERPCTDFSKTIRDLAEAIKPTLEVTQNV